MIFSLRNEFAELLAETDYTLDENLVRAAVRAYIKARIRGIKRQKNPRLRARLINRNREQMRRYRAAGSTANKRDKILKPSAARKTLIPRRPREIQISIGRY